MSFWVAGATVVGSVGSALISKKKAPGKADVPELDVGKVASQTMDSNIANLSKATSLTSSVNTASQADATRLMELAMPGFSKLQSSLVKSAQSDLDNQYNLPPEIMAQLERKSAEMGVSLGAGGDVAQRMGLARFGFNLVDYSNAQRVKALNTLSTLTGMTPRVNPLSPMSQLVDVNTAIKATARNQEMAYEAEQGHLNAQAAARNSNASIMGSMFSKVAGVAGNALDKKFGG